MYTGTTERKDQRALLSSPRSLFYARFLPSHASRDAHRRVRQTNRLLTGDSRTSERHRESVRRTNLDFSDIPRARLGHRSDIRVPSVAAISITTQRPFDSSHRSARIVVVARRRNCKCAREEGLGLPNNGGQQCDFESK